MKKTNHTNLCCVALLSVCSASGLVRLSALGFGLWMMCQRLEAEHTIADSLRVDQSIYIGADADFAGTVFMGSLPQNPQMEGFRVEVSQSSWQQTYENYVPGYSTWETVVQEIYGEIPQYGYQEIWDYVYLGEIYIEPVYDGEGNLLSDGYSYPNYQYQSIGYSEYQSGSYWGVTGTQEVQQETWHEGYYETLYGETIFDAPRIQMTASRSDSSWAWRNPSSSGVPGETKDLMILSDGGLTFPSDGNSASIATVGQHGLNLNRGVELTNGIKNHAVSVDNYGVQNTTTEELQASTSASWRRNISMSYLQSHSLEFRRTEIASAETGGTTADSVLTQIAAKSAHFGGVITVEGNINTKGVIRVLPAGDISMGSFHTGNKPDGTYDEGGN